MRTLFTLLLTLMALLKPKRVAFATTRDPDDPDGDDGGAGDGDDGGAGDGDGEELGEAGKAALVKERTARREADKLRKQAEKAAADATKKLEAAQAATQTADEKKLNEARKDAAKEATDTTKAAFAKRILSTEIMAAATGVMVDPTDAVALLDLTDFDVDADEKELRAKIKSAVEQLVKDKPHLKDSEFKGGGDGGAKRPADASKDEDLTPQERLRRAYSSKK